MPGVIVSEELLLIIDEIKGRKAKYIQKPCEQATREDQLYIDQIRELFQKYWKIAVITAEENSLLKGPTMPEDRDSKNIFARYQESGIELVRNPL